MPAPKETWHNGVLVDRLEDNGDGTGMFYEYEEDGITIKTTQAVTGLPIEETPIEEPPSEPIVAPDAALRMREAFDSIATGSLTVSKLKLAMQAAIDALGTTE